MVSQEGIATIEEIKSDVLSWFLSKYKTTTNSKKGKEFQVRKEGSDELSDEFTESDERSVTQSTKLTDILTDSTSVEKYCPIKVGVDYTLEEIYMKLARDLADYFGDTTLKEFFKAKGFRAEYSGSLALGDEHDMFVRHDVSVAFIKPMDGKKGSPNVQYLDLSKVFDGKFENLTLKQALNRIFNYYGTLVVNLRETYS